MVDEIQSLGRCRFDNDDRVTVHRCFPIYVDVAADLDLAGIGFNG